jgi:hypothetical protein
VTLRELVDTLRATHRFGDILFNDPEIRGCKAMVWSRESFARKNQIAAIAVPLFCALSFGVSAADNILWGEFNGSYRIAPQEMYDPAPDAKPDRVGLNIYGSAAKDIYQTMPGPVMRPLCDGKPGPMTKTAGGLMCQDSNGNYYCWVVIKLDTGETIAGHGCV